MLRPFGRPMKAQKWLPEWLPVRLLKHAIRCERLRPATRMAPVTMTSRNPQALSGVARHCGTMISGEGGIRTPGWCYPTPVFKTGAFGHSATSPNLLCRSLRDLWARLFSVCCFLDRFQGNTAPGEGLPRRQSDTGTLPVGCSTRAQSTRKRRSGKSLTAQLNRSPVSLLFAHTSGAWKKPADRRSLGPWPAGRGHVSPMTVENQCCVVAGPTGCRRRQLVAPEAKAFAVRTAAQG